jgi:hypothetical protein
MNTRNRVSGFHGLKQTDSRSTQFAKTLQISGLWLFKCEFCLKKSSQVLDAFEAFDPYADR